MSLKKFNNLIYEYNKLKNIGDLFNAEAKLRLALKIEPNNSSLINELSLLCIDKKDYTEALGLLLRANRINKNNNVIINNIGNLCCYLGRYDEAIEYLENSIYLNSNYLPAYLNLIAAWNHLGNDKKVLDITIEAIKKWPGSPELHVNLAAALNGMQLLDEALVSLETALILKPDYIEANLNIAAIESQKGNNLKAVRIYEKFISEQNENFHERIPLAKYFLSYEYLASGRLKDGWEYYKNGFDNLIPNHIKRRPNRVFNHPQWDGDSLENKVLLIWAEQGLGDEIMFMSILPSFLRDNPKVNLIVECDIRLNEIVQRTFSNISVRQPFYHADFLNGVEDFDYHLPIGGLTRIYRNKIDDFYSENFIFKVDLDLKYKYLNRLHREQKPIKIGICWRSGLLNSKRNTFYSALKDWTEIFKLKNTIFVNLQYGDCENELLKFEAEHSIEIVRWNDVDLKNNLDDVLSIIDCLDLVITPATAVCAMAASIGKEVYLFKPKHDWTSLGTDALPFFPTVKVFTPREGYPVAECFPSIRTHINEKYPITK